MPKAVLALLAPHLTFKAHTAPNKILLNSRFSVALCRVVTQHKAPKIDAIRFVPLEILN